MDVLLLVLPETLCFDRPNPFAILAEILIIWLLWLAALNDFNLRFIHAVIVDREVELGMFLFLQLPLESVDIAL